jgi:transcriptional regulator with XRE-family HTH domain
MLGTELREWRKRNSWTQEKLRQELGIKSRRTIISWEKSTAVLPRMVVLALLALDKMPQARHVGGNAYKMQDYKEQQARTVY